MAMRFSGHSPQVQHARTNGSVGIRLPAPSSSLRMVLCRFGRCQPSKAVAFAGNWRALACDIAAIEPSEVALGRRKMNNDQMHCFLSQLRKLIELWLSCCD